ncbi:hypothetical protein [Bacillus sp. SD075]|uniref:hypothetical protein n=1 Tax=Bacillus sp. SD075 TaxID=2781732 RepID=UPI00257110B6|nr:hypothetical protein [Bacillus sp. SD075]
MMGKLYSNVYRKMKSLVFTGRIHGKIANNTIRKKRAVRWGIERKDTQGLIGTIGFHAHSPNTGGRKSVMKSILHIGAKDLCQESLNKLSVNFNDLDLTRIGAVVILENGPSSDHCLSWASPRKE